MRLIYKAKDWPAGVVLEEMYLSKPALYKLVQIVLEEVKKNLPASAVTVDIGLEVTIHLEASAAEASMQVHTYVLEKDKPPKISVTDVPLNQEHEAFEKLLQEQVEAENATPSESTR